MPELTVKRETLAEVIMRASGCSSNEELSAALAEMETLRSPHVIQAFRHVDRGFFVPEPDRATIYDDRPFRKPLGGSDGALLDAPCGVDGSARVGLLGMPGPRPPCNSRGPCAVREFALVVSSDLQ